MGHEAAEEDMRANDRRNNFPAVAFSKRAEAVAGALVIAALGTVIFWETMANRSRKPFADFELTAEDFKGFVPVGEGWTVRKLPVGSDRTEPNILAFELARKTGPESQRRACGGSRVMARLVHGYNMPDCMRLKGYKVELIELGSAGGTQSWLLKAPGGREEIWLTSIVTAGSFRETGIDTRSMPFPRIAGPVDSGWVSKGITKQTLRHPIAAFRTYLRERWNSSRCDLATFLRLRQPAWASDELLTVVVATLDPVRPGAEQDAIGLVRDGHAFFLRCLREWRGAESAFGAIDGGG